MTDDELNEQVSQLARATQVIVDPTDDLGQALFADITSAPAAEMFVDTAGADTSVPHVESDWVELEPVGRARRLRRLALAAAACVVFAAAIVGALVATNNTNSVATDDTNGGDPNAVSAPGNPIEGFDFPLVLIEPDSLNSAECLAAHNGLLPPGGGFPALGIVVRRTSSPSVLGSGDELSAIDFGDLLVFCRSGQEIDGSSVSFNHSGGLVGFNQGPPGSRPSVVVNGGHGGRLGESQTWVSSIEGTIEEGVSNVQLVGREGEEQVFWSLGSYFTLDVVSPTGQMLDDDSMIEVTFDDGTTEQFLVFVERPRCDEGCVQAWYEWARNNAAGAANTDQLRALEDLALTQDEYDFAVERFGDCVALDLPGSVPEGSEAATFVRECYTDHLEFIDQARLIHNQVWQGSDER